MTTKMNLSALESNVKQWSQARGILEQSTCAKQVKKYNEERLEMMDAIGDQVVCLINASFFAGDEDRQTNKLRSKIADLKKVCEFLRIDFDECLGMAWDAIKDRKGLMIDGLFVKYDNLSEEQKRICDETQ